MKVASESADVGSKAQQHPRRESRKVVDFAKKPRSIAPPKSRALLAIGRPAHGDTEGDTHGDTRGDSVSPSCIPQPGCKFRRKYKALADRSASRINPDLPLGALPLGLPSFHLHAGFIFQQFYVPLQIAPHHHGFQPDGCRRFIGDTVEMEQILSGCACLCCASGSSERLSTQLCRRLAKNTAAC
jgi:hypothetical protein